LQITEGAVSTSVGAAAPTTVDTLLQHLQEGNISNDVTMPHTILFMHCFELIMIFFFFFFFSTKVLTFFSFELLTKPNIQPSLRIITEEQQRRRWSQANNTRSLSIFCFAKRNNSYQFFLEEKNNNKIKGIL
jgi:hypothetical protein